MKTHKYVYIIVLASLWIGLTLSGCGGSASGGDAGTSSSSSSSTNSSSSTSSSIPFSGTGCTVPALQPTESRPTLVVRISYSDIAMRNDAASWHDKCFGMQEHELNHFFQSTSNGRFSLAEANENEGTAGDGIISVTLGKVHPNSGTGTGIHPDLKTALTMANAYIDYSQYDTDANGAITPDELLIIFIVAGYEDAFYPPSTPGVWAHQSCVDYTNAAYLDGVWMMGCAQEGNYALFGERHRDDTINYDHDATVGIIAHELGHAAFELPDLYDTSGQSGGIGYFGLMGSGLWGQESLMDLYGNTPVPMSAWSRLHNGWYTPQIVRDTTQEDLVLYDTDSAAYNIVLLPASSHECFLVENRAVTGYDKGLFVIDGFYKGGAAVWHVDQSVIDAKSAYNTVNAYAAHKGVDLEEAAQAELDSDYTARGHAKNLFYYGNRTEFTPATSPDSNRYDGDSSGIELTGFTAPGSTMQVTAANPN